MRIKKSLIVFLVVILLLTLFVSSVVFAIVTMNLRWKDASTWTTEEKLIIPTQTENLKVSNVVEATVDSNIKVFSFKTEYCYLYEISRASDGESATLHCSLLPMYYIDRAKETPNEWQAKADVLLKVDKNDPVPNAFLDRFDTSFESVSNLGSNKMPVSIEISGKYTYPSDTFSARFSHLFLTLSGKKEKLAAVISSFSVNRLDQPTPEQVHEYALNWSNEMKTFVNNRIVANGLDKKSGEEYLDSAKTTYRHNKLKCSSLQECTEEYPGNSAVIFMYSLYNAEKFNKEYFKHGRQVVLTSLYPFNEIEPTIAPEGAPAHWKVYSAYTFPICPVNDLVTGVKSEGFALFEKYAKAEPLANSEISKSEEYLALLNSGEYSAKTIEEEWNVHAGWNADRVYAINSACAESMNGSSTQYLQLRSRVLEVYYQMLSQNLGTTFNGSTTNAEKIIYESNAYSPYVNRFILDYGVSRFREEKFESNEESAINYVEWKSVLASYILLYQYDN